MFADSPTFGEHIRQFAGALWAALDHAAATVFWIVWCAVWLLGTIELPGSSGPTVAIHAHNVNQTIGERPSSNTNN